ncbi:hypothetical protein R50072_20920 [Simiduia litorea]
MDIGMGTSAATIGMVAIGVSPYLIITVTAIATAIMAGTIERGITAATIIGMMATMAEAATTMVATAMAATAEIGMIAATTGAMGISAVGTIEIGMTKVAVARIVAMEIDQLNR